MDTLFFPNILIISSHFYDQVLVRQSYDQDTKKRVVMDGYITQIKQVN